MLLFPPASCQLLLVGLMIHALLFCCTLHVRVLAQTRDRALNTESNFGDAACYVPTGSREQDSDMKKKINMHALRNS